MSKLNQIISLCWWLQTNTSLTTSLKLNGSKDYVSVKVSNSNDVLKYEKVIESLTKKHEPILLKELDQISNNLVLLKTEINEKLQ